MNLPMIESTPIYVITLPISNQEVKYRPYKVGEEITFLTALNSEDKINTIESFFDLVKSCVLTESFSFDNLSLIDFSYLLFHIRAKSKGESVDIDKICSKCNFKEPYSFDILESILIENKDVKKLIIDVTDVIKIEIGLLSYTYLKSSLDYQNTKDELAMYTLASSVRKIVYNGEIHTKFTPEEVTNNFIKNLSKIQLKMISEELNKLPRMKGQIKCTCPSCKHEDTITLDDLFSFLD